MQAVLEAKSITWKDARTLYKLDRRFKRTRSDVDFRRLSYFKGMLADKAIGDLRFRETSGGPDIRVVLPEQERILLREKSLVAVSNLLTKPNRLVIKSEVERDSWEGVQKDFERLKKGVSSLLLLSRVNLGLAVLSGASLLAVHAANGFSVLKSPQGQLDSVTLAISAVIPAGMAVLSWNYLKTRKKAFSNLAENIQMKVTTTAVELGIF